MLCATAAGRDGLRTQTDKDLAVRRDTRTSYWHGLKTMLKVGLLGQAEI